MVDIIYEELANYITKSKNLKTFEFSVLTLMSARVSDSVIIKLCTAIINNNSIDTIGISGYSNSGVQNVYIKMLPSILIQNKNIIKLRCCNQGEIIQDLTALFLQLDHYSLIDLTLECCMNQSQLEILSEKMRTNTTILSLDIQLYGENPQYLLNALGANTILKSLTVHTCAKKIDSFDFLNIGCLKHFSFWDSIDSKQMFNILHQLETNDSLQFLSVCATPKDERAYELFIDKLFDVNWSIIKLCNMRKRTNIVKRMQDVTNRNKLLLANRRFANIKAILKR